MNIHEYQAKDLFRQFGVPVPAGRMAETADEAKRIAQDLGTGVVAVKAQIHAGGRGKGGGVKIVDNVDAAFQAATSLLGYRLVTPQTGLHGQTVRRLLIEAGHRIKKEYYVGLTLDRSLGLPVFMVSTEGGMDIEEVAEKTPEKIFRETVDPGFGLLPFQGRGLASSLGFDGNLIRTAADVFAKIYQLFTTLDASLVEINPLILTADDDILALDGKINFDDNALFRHPEIKALADPYETDPLELEAVGYGLNYIRLEGNIGAMVNGAGLAMATMDLIKQAGAEPANFLDVGGGANADMIANGFRIILSDERVKAVLINIFGGILRCDVLARGVIEAASREKVTVPIIIRMEGTNVEEGRRILEESDLEFTVAGDLLDAAAKVAAVVRD
jgi:succinyl-CoA synthetase beta subunit